MTTRKTTRPEETRTFKVTTSQAAGYGTRLVTLDAATAEYWARVWRAAGHEVEAL